MQGKIPSILQRNTVFEVIPHLGPDDGQEDAEIAQ